MKLIYILSALAVAASEGCEADGDFKCSSADQVCVYRYTLDVSNPKDKDYKALLKKDPQAIKGGELYTCSAKEEAESLVATSKTKDAKTTLTFSYEIKKAKGGEGEEDHDEHDHDEEEKETVLIVKILLAVLVTLSGMFVFFPYTPCVKNESKKK